MKIISKFHDYYDTVQQFGIDEALVYVRNETELKTTSPELIDLSSKFCERKYRFRRAYSDESFIVFVCGKAHLCYILETGTSSYQKNIRKFCYSVDDVGQFYRQCLDAGLLSKKEYRKKLESLDERDNSFRVAFNNFEEYFRLRDTSNLFIEFEAPVFILKNEKDANIILNPCLRDINFEKVIDSFTINQEISMFLGMVIPAPKKKGTKTKKRPVDWVDPIDSDNFSDKTKRDSKGFDDWSFKKKPTKRK